MAAQQLRAATGLSFLPRISTSRLFSTPNFASVYMRQLSIPLLPSLPSLLEDIWGSILKAVPKKKTSHMKKRHRQMAGKALKDTNSLCKCPACGRVKRMHHLCPYCTEEIRQMMKMDAKQGQQGEQQTAQH